MILISSWIGVVSAQEARPTPRPRIDRSLFGAPPTLPMTDIDEADLTEEERELFREQRERYERVGLPPGSSFSDFLEKLLTPKPFAKEKVHKIDDKYAYPHPVIAVKMEIVKEEGDVIWLRGISPENPESPFHELYNRWQISELLTQDRIDNPRPEIFVDFEAEIVPPPFVDAFSFEEVVSGLPDRGRWQMNMAFADMNEDGIEDIVFPPERKGTPVPTIFLGEGGGRFHLWREVRWPRKVSYDYGGIAVGDYDGDGHQDVAIAVHFKAQHVIYGNGEGQFERHNRLPCPDPRITSRAVTAADFNTDGRLDLAFQAEINYDQGTSSRMHGATVVWITLNRGNGKWELVSDVIEKGKLIGDYIESPDVNNDGRPDLLLSSNTSNWRSLVYLNLEDGWQQAEFTGVLSAAYHFDVALGAKPQHRAQSVFGAFLQYKRVHGKNTARTGIVSYAWVPQGLTKAGAPLVLAEGRLNSYQRLAVGDLNRDGLSDVVAGRKDGTVEVFIQSEGGTFYREQAPELVAAGRPFDIHLLDLDGDGLDDIIVSSVINEKTGARGGLKVWLTRRDA
jgi:hypothetical protein